MLSDGSRTITYDGENRPVAVNGVTYAYGPDGKRLKKIAADGKVTRLPRCRCRTRCRVRRLDQIPARRRKRVGSGESAVTTWMHRDHLTSVRLITGSAGAAVARAGYAPYGDQSPTLRPVKGLDRRKIRPRNRLAIPQRRYYDPLLPVHHARRLGPAAAGCRHQPLRLRRQ